MRKNLRTFLFIAVIALFHMSCEYDPDGSNYQELDPLPSQIGVSINLADVELGGTVYIYGPTALYYQIEPDIGELRSVAFRYNGETIGHEGIFNVFRIDPDVSDAGVEKELEMEVGIVAKDNSLAGALGGYLYTTTINYKVKYVRITADDFAVKDQIIDEIVFQMVNKNSDPCKFVINGKEVTDLDNIVFERDLFPFYIDERMYLLPRNASPDDYREYNYIKLEFKDKTLGDTYMGHVNYFIDQAREELYTWSPDRLYVYDKEMNLLGKKEMSITELAVTPVSGLVVCCYEGVVNTYSDKSFSTRISTIDGIFKGYRVNERDQLIQGHNFQVDVFDLHTGLLVYTIPFPSGVGRFDVSKDGKYLVVGSGGKSHVYTLNDDSATFLYSSEKTGVTPRFHPVNKHHIVLDNITKGFEVFDVDTRQTVFSSKGEFQSIDPIIGNLMYRDEDYGNNHKNHFVNSSYNEIYVWINGNSGLGDFTQFNNYLIQGQHYIDFSSKLTNQ